VSGCHVEHDRFGSLRLEPLNLLIAMSWCKVVV
jgi:hypothetical protein